MITKEMQHRLWDSYQDIAQDHRHSGTLCDFRYFH